MPAAGAGCLQSLLPGKRSNSVFVIAAWGCATRTGCRQARTATPSGRGHRVCPTPGIATKSAQATFEAPACCELFLWTRRVVAMSDDDAAAAASSALAAAEDPSGETATGTLFGKSVSAAPGSSTDPVLMRAVGAPPVSLTQQIEVLKLEQKAARDARKVMAKNLKNAQKRKRRLQGRARQLSNDDLVAVLTMRADTLGVVKTIAGVHKGGPQGRHQGVPGA